MITTKKKLDNCTKCSICLITFTDPRQLPCIHTFCLHCLEVLADTADKYPGDGLPCPLCRNWFVIPPDGLRGLPKNFLMKNVIEISQELVFGCGVKFCHEHNNQTMEYYCLPCRKLVYISCVDESHQTHDYKDVDAVKKELRSTIDRKSTELDNYIWEAFTEKQDIKQRKTEFLTNLDEIKKTILQRRTELKNLIDQHTETLLNELLSIKEEHLQIMDSEIKEAETKYKTLKEFENRCVGIASVDICESFMEDMTIFDAIEKDHEYSYHPYLVAEVSLDERDPIQSWNFSDENCIGRIKVSQKKIEDLCAFVIGLYDGSHVSNDVIAINLHGPSEIEDLGNTPFHMMPEAVAATYNNTIYMVGVGGNSNEIWKHHFWSGWEQCASLTQGRRGHSVAFVNEVLYICGGVSVPDETLLDSIETYNASTDECKEVGHLILPFVSHGNCLAYQNSLYIFGGLDVNREAMTCVQIFDTLHNISKLLENPIPTSHCWIQAVWWKNFVILLGSETCHIFNSETETWQERNQFKTDVDHFGAVLCNDHLFVLGGGVCGADADKRSTWTCRDEVRFVPVENIIKDEPTEWKVHAKLPKPSMMFAACAVKHMNYHPWHLP